MSGPEVSCPPTLDLRSTDSQGWRILQVSGEIDAYTAPVLRKHLLGVITSGHTGVVLDLSGVSFLDSTALGILIAGEKRLRAVSGHLRVVVSSPMVLRVLQITALDSVFDLYPTLAAALSGEPHIPLPVREAR